MFYLAGIFSNIAVNCHVVFQKFDLSKAMPTHVTHVLLLIICVMSFHVQSKIFLSIELLPTLLTGIIEVCAVAHLLMLLELRLPLVALLALVALVGLVCAVDILHVVVQAGVAREMLGAEVAHECVGRVVQLSVTLELLVASEALLTVLTSLLEGVELARALLVVVNELYGRRLSLANFCSTNWTVKAGVYRVIIRTILDPI